MENASQLQTLQQQTILALKNWCLTPPNKESQSRLKKKKAGNISAIKSMTRVYKCGIFYDKF